MNSLNIPVPAKLSLHFGNVAENWRKFKQSWQYYEIAAGADKKSSKIRSSLLLSVIGEEALDVYGTFEWATPADSFDIDLVIDQFEKYCIPRSNVLFETYRFGCRKQLDDEPIDSFVTALRKIAENCNFAEKTRRIRDQVVLGLKDARVRERILRENDPSLTKVLEFVRASETAEKQSKEITGFSGAEEANQLNKKSVASSKQQQQNFKKKKFVPKDKMDKKECKFCGGQHEMKKEKCPAWGKDCKNCAKKNHFSKCCRIKKNPVQAVEEEAVHVFNVGEQSHSKKTKTVKVLSTGRQVTFQIDTGATCNVLSFDDYVKATDDKQGRNLKKRKVKIVTYGGATWNSTGVCDIEVLVNGKQHTLNCIVVQLKAHPLMCLKTCEELGIVKVLSCDQENIMAVTKKNGLTEKDILEKYSDVFTGLGTLEGEYRIVLDPEVQPVIHAARKVPVSLREELKTKLAELEQQGVIARVTQPTEWVSSMMLVKKPNKLRICLDPKDLNKAIRREHYPLPTIEEVATRLKDAKIFSVLDAKNGFWQVKLDEESSFLTTFNTPFGRFRWMRMPFGINSAPEVWQRKMHEFAENLKGVEVIADDFLVSGYGNTEEEAIHDHDQNLCALLERARIRNLKLNRDKLRLKMDEVPFIGHILTKDGLKMDPKKLEAIHKMPLPQNAADLMRILGMVQYLSKFLPKLSDVTEPLRRLTDKGAEWLWSKQHENAWKTVKSLMTSAPVLAYFDEKKEVTIQCDASDSGLGAVLLQEGRPIAFSSRAMTKTEQRYAQIEKEMLAIVHSCMKFEQYIYGRKCVTIESDHKPLEVIFKKSIADSPKRLQRMLLYLQKYRLNVGYKKGAHMYIADTLSRAYLNEVPKTEERYDVLSVEERKFCHELESTTITSEIQNSKSRMEEIRSASKEDAILQLVTKYVLSGWPENSKVVEPEVIPYYGFKDELTSEDGLVFKGDRVVIPKKLRPSVMKNIHSTHIGIEGCLRRAREYVYWPRMNAELKDYMAKCDICNTFRSEQPKEPMVSTEVPSRAWSTVSTDLFELNKEHFIIIVDHYSNYFEYDRLRETTTAYVVTSLKKIFSRFGIPEKVISDNGPQYASSEFRKFAKEWGFDHRTSSPGYPQSNGKAENAVKTCKLLMKKALEGKVDFFKSLIDWRNTPSAEIGLSPAQRMFGRRIRTMMPAKNCLLLPMELPDVQNQIVQSKVKQKAYYDRGSKPLKDLKCGDVVRMRLPGQKKWTKGEILRKRGGRSYDVSIHGDVYRRNRRQLIATQEEIPQEQNREDFGESMEEPPDSTMKLRRSQRRRSMPAKFHDYV